jgi:uncharacterized membrane protein
MNPRDEPSIQGGYSLDRDIYLTDGVFAFVVTLMVLDLVVPSILPGASSADLWVALSKEYVIFFNYALSFLIAGAWWMGHNRIFGYLRSSDSTLRWLNLLFLMWIALLPFFTKILSSYIELQLALILYASDQTAAGFFVTLMWWHSSRNHRLVDKRLEDSTIRHVLLFNAFVPLWFIFSICFSFVIQDVTVYLWLGIFPLRVLANRIRPDRKKKSRD